MINISFRIEEIERSIQVDFPPIQLTDLEFSDTVLGKGATGRVVAGNLKKGGSNVAVAIKTLESVALLDQKLHLREISMLMKSQSSPYIVRFYGVAVSSDRFHLVMERYDTDLFAYFQRKEASLSGSLNVMHGITQALQFLHSLTLIHRDVKPKNIFLTKKGSGVLGDLGCTRNVMPSQMTVNTGTSYYRDPLIRGGVPYGTEVDVFSFGMVLQDLIQVIKALIFEKQARMIDDPVLSF